MSGIAEILLTLGFRVSGSDLKENPSCERLRELGATIAIGHDRKNLPADCSLLVYSSAVTVDNLEIVEARARGLPVVRRAEVLAELIRLKFGVAVAGSHGKTTTTSMLGWILERAGLDPTVIVGGQVKSFGTGGKLGKSAYLVAETDESDRSFLLLRPTIAIVTNIDREHLVAYTSFQELQDCFRQFILSVPFYGLAVLCTDDPYVHELSSEYERRKCTYGLKGSPDVLARNLQVNQHGTAFEVVVHGELVGAVSLPMYGAHFALNSLAAIAVGLEFGVTLESIIEALRTFPGVQRRIEYLDEAGGVEVFNDYAHHPTEIRATIAALRARGRPLKILFEPHRYSRVRASLEDFSNAFAGAALVVVTDVYGAGEPYDPNACSEALVERLTGVPVLRVATVEEGMQRLVADCCPGDTIVCMGAGPIGKAAPQFVELVRASSEPEAPKTILTAQVLER